MKEKIIVDNLEDVWNIVYKIGNNRIDFVFDNLGFELFIDLCFVEFLLYVKLVEYIYFYIK